MTLTMQQHFFIDIEASSLASGSYPIEVAWGQTPETIESHLISPEHISSWTDWSPASERLHGIPRNQLLDQGQPPGWVARRINAALGGQTVYCDNPDYDRHWLDELFKKSGGLKPDFEIACADRLLLMHLSSFLTSHVAAQQRLEQLKALARVHLQERHRAAKDVAFLLTLYRLVMREPISL